MNVWRRKKTINVYEEKGSNLELHRDDQRQGQGRGWWWGGGDGGGGEGATWDPGGETFEAKRLHNRTWGGLPQSHPHFGRKSGQHGTKFAPNMQPR